MNNTPSLSVEVLSTEQGRTVLPELDTLLIDTVTRGASIGFLPPLSEDESSAYWNSVLDKVAQQTVVLLVARHEGTVVGTVQLELATKANARHRAEVQKLMVLQSQRGQDIGKLLMGAIEGIAQEHKRTLLVLDTRQGDTAEQLYRKLGYIEAGVIPSYARNAEGSLDATVLFYKLLV